MGLFSSTRTVRIFGASDRFIIVEGGVCDDGNELNTSTNPKLRAGEGLVGTLLLSTGRPGESLCIHAIFDGYWSFALSPGEGDSEPFPQWPIRRLWAKDNENAETLEIEVPRDARLQIIERFAPDF